MKTTLRSAAFLESRAEDWAELETLVRKAETGGLKALSTAQLHRLPVLYRQLVASLSVARRTTMDQHTLKYLEGLAAEAYIAVHGSRSTRRGAFRRFLFERFPREVRAIAGEVGLATGFMALGVVVAIGLMNTDPGWYDAFVDPGLAAGRDPNANTDTLREALYGGGEMSEGGTLSVFAGFLFVHNARIGLTAFALGFAAGIPTALLMFSTGLMLGGFIHLYASRGLLFELGGWMLPHGIPEIGAVILCGAAGLHIGRQVLRPGRLTVRDAMVQAGRRGSIVATGSVALFAIAGVIEGVFRQVVTDDILRYGLAAFNGLWFAMVFTLLGRKRDDGQGRP